MNRDFLFRLSAHFLILCFYFPPSGLSALQHSALLCGTTAFQTVLYVVLCWASSFLCVCVWTHSNQNLFASALPGKQKKQQHLECKMARLYFCIFSHQQEVFNYVKSVSKRSEMQWRLGKSVDELETKWSCYLISCCLSCHSLTKGNATTSDIFIYFKYRQLFY